VSVGSEPVLAERATRWADLRLRVISAAVLAPLALFCVWFGGWLYTLMLVAGFAGVVWEWGHMCRWRPLPLILGTLYAAVALGSMWVWRGIDGARAIYILLAIVWCSDIGAYIVGRLVGGPRLAPRVSPGKTWSGAVGGLVAAIIGGAVVAGMVSVQIAGFAAVLGVASQLGDLGESALKRAYNVKDSGRLVPGHGGLLDRLDGLMAAAIVAGFVLLVTTAKLAIP
jgi:phosphatidate cytidylyltransferase